MEAAIIIISVVIELILIWGMFAWIYYHRCAICGNIHMDENELKRCKTCDRLFCIDKSTLHETIKSDVKSAIGEGIHVQKENHRKYHGVPCGYVFIETDWRGPRHSRYCRLHNPSPLKTLKFKVQKPIKIR